MEDNATALHFHAQQSQQEERLHVGARFDTLEDLKTAIAQYALSSNRTFCTKRSDKRRGIVLVCANAAPSSSQQEQLAPALLGGVSDDIVGGGVVGGCVGGAHVNGGSDIGGDAHVVGDSDIGGDARVVVGDGVRDNNGIAVGSGAALPQQSLPLLLQHSPGASWTQLASIASPEQPRHTHRKTPNRACSFIVFAIPCDSYWVVKEFRPHTCAPTAAGVRLPRKMAEQILKRQLLIAKDGKGTLSTLQGHAITTSKRTAHRIATEIKQEAAGGSLQAIPALLDREKMIDNDTTTHWEVSRNAAGQCTFERCFIAWGAGQRPSSTIQRGLPSLMQHI
jgi:hypothetical protein